MSGRVNGSDLALVREHSTSLETRLFFIQPPTVAAQLQKFEAKATESLAIAPHEYSTTNRTKVEHAPAKHDSLTEELFLNSVDDDARVAALTLAAQPIEESSIALALDHEQVDLD